jgi:hypothetical protein
VRLAVTIFDDTKPRRRIKRRRRFFIMRIKKIEGYLGSYCIFGEIHSRAMAEMLFFGDPSTSRSEYTR